ncbi:DNA topoisomerase IB, partial [Pseudomonas syringae]|nr:DNA topoisomerase IB [Pseudomonas syringae]
MPDSTAISPPASDLHYVDDTQPGLTRKILREKFAYFDTQGKRIKDESEIK